MFDEDSAAGGGGAAGGSTAELCLPARSERELTIVYQPSRVEVVDASLVIKPVVRPRNGVVSKFTVGWWMLIVSWLMLIVSWLMLIVSRLMT